jgi:predicted DNA-binding protein (MmcQ/YjbR family)
MNVAALKRFCAALPAARSEIKWQVDCVYVVGGKMFAIIFEQKPGQVRISFKVDDERFLELTDRPGFMPAPYLARAKWVQVHDVTKVDYAELKHLLARSHQLIVARLPKKTRAALGVL